MYNTDHKYSSDVGGTSEHLPVHLMGTPSQSTEEESEEPIKFQLL